MPRSPVHPLELFAIDGLLTDEERAIRATVREFCDRELRPHIAEWFEAGTLPARDVARRLGGLGLLGMHLEGYGCAGTNAVSYGLACFELEAVDSGLRSLMSVQGSLAMYAIWKYGSPEQKERWLPAMAKGERIGCFGLTEPDFGSNPAGMRTTAKREPGGDWVLTGTKMWITNGSVADVAVVWARTDEEGAGAGAGGEAHGKGIRGFLVPTDTPGFSAPEIKRKQSLRASFTNELVLDDVRLPADAVLPGARGLGGPLGCLNEARFGIVFGSMGAALDCLETALAYAGDREIFDRPLASFQLTQRKLADMALEAGKGMLLALHLGRLKDAGTLTPEQVSAGKLNNVREAIAIARECRTILGANGITLEYPVIRHACNLESVLTYEGTDEVHTLVLGRALTGHAAFQ
ncbi:MAG TPA: acyl-CoA dehydrogenase family protein [Streptosporangiaceae bacterium]|nr:acyl-CoA dehydrogenase family protein [Streptosporangiaceae bacterium]